MNSPVTTPGESRSGHYPLGKFWRVAGCCLVCLLLAGCATPQSSTGPNKSAALPDNVFMGTAFLPARLQRVALLPVACERSDPVLAEKCEGLRSVMLEELIRTKKFEVVAVNPETLRRRTGRADWTGAETLPADFLGQLQGEYGCDAVLFCQLTSFHAYAPLTIGWRLKMVDVRTRQIIWAADEVFDALQPPATFREWLAEQMRQAVGPESADKWAMQNSPLRFGHESAARLLATLPDR